MLEYKNLHAVKQARLRLKHDRYRWSNEGKSKDEDSLVVFTIGHKADDDAKHNLEFCLHTGRNFNAEYLVLHDNLIQFVGKQIKPGIVDSLIPKPWRQDYDSWVGQRGQIDVYDEGSYPGEVYAMRFWRRAFATQLTQGIYELSTGQRIKNRREIIQRFWDLGFASQRGVPLSVCKIRYSGSRNELEELTKMADRYWSNRHKSDVAKKTVSMYNSINRYAAWPGAW